MNSLVCESQEDGLIEGERVVMRSWGVGQGVGGGR